jgi:hypothetical protein
LSLFLTEKKDSAERPEWICLVQDLQKARVVEYGVEEADGDMSKLGVILKNSRRAPRSAHIKSQLILFEEEDSDKQVEEP